jgi:hypothetical protein
MIHIDRIRMRLPAGLEHRATSIARLVGEQLAKRSVSQDVSLESVSVKPPQITSGMPDIEIATLIVQQLAANFGGRQP